MLKTVLLSKHRKHRKLKYVFKSNSIKKLNRVPIDLIYINVAAEIAKSVRIIEKNPHARACINLELHLPSLTKLATSDIMNVIQLNLSYLNINSAKTVLLFADLK